MPFCSITNLIVWLYFPHVWVCTLLVIIIIFCLPSPCTYSCSIFPAGFLLFVVSTYVCVCWYVFLRTFIYFLLSTIVHIAHFFHCLLSFQLCRQSSFGFFFRSLYLQCMLRKSGTHQTRYQVRFILSWKWEKSLSLYAAKFCRFKSKWISGI